MCVCMYVCVCACTDSALASLDEKIAGKWRKYCQLKANFYTACVCIHQAFSFLAIVCKSMGVCRNSGAVNIGFGQFGA